MSNKGKIESGRKLFEDAVKKKMDVAVKAYNLIKANDDADLIAAMINDPLLAKTIAAAACVQLAETMHALIKEAAQAN